MVLSHSVPSAPVLVTENNDDGWQMTGSSREAPQSHPITCTYSSRGGGIWENTSPTRKRGSYLSEKRARKAGGEQMRERHIYVVTNHCERYLLFESSATTQEQGCATNFFSKPWKVQVPTDSLVAKSKTGHVFKTTKRHNYSLPNFPPDVLGPLYKNSMYLVCNKNTPKSLEPCAYNSYLCSFHVKTATL